MLYLDPENEILKKIEKIPIKRKGVKLIPGVGGDGP